jgi:hypothetical protein
MHSAGAGAFDPLRRSEWRRDDHAYQPTRSAFVKSGISSAYATSALPDELARLPATLLADNGEP